LAGGHAGVGTAATREQELAGLLVGGLYIIIDGLASLFAQFKPDGPTRFPLSYRCAIRRVAAGRYAFEERGDNIRLIHHGHAPGLGYREQEAWATIGIEIRTAFGQCGLRGRLSGK
jgi:hypothetical protein